MIRKRWHCRSDERFAYIVDFCNAVLAYEGDYTAKKPVLLRIEPVFTLHFSISSIGCRYLTKKIPYDVDENNDVTCTGKAKTFGSKDLFGVPKKFRGLSIKESETAR